MSGLISELLGKAMRIRADNPNADIAAFVSPEMESQMIETLEGLWYDPPEDYRENYIASFGGVTWQLDRAMAGVRVRFEVKK